MRVISFLMIIFLSSCNSLEKDHEVKENVRDYLKQIVHDWDSFEELSWEISDNYSLIDCDTSGYKGIKNDLRWKKIDGKGFVKGFYDGKWEEMIELEFKARNGYNALRKDVLYSIAFYENDSLKFIFINDIVYHKGVGKIGKAFKNPKKEYYVNYYFSRNECSTFKDFYNKYPEFNQ